MNDRTWLDALDIELRSRRLTVEARVEVVAEVETFLEDSEASALDEFGLPGAYADAIADAITARGRRPKAPETSVVLQADGVGKRFRQAAVVSNTSVVLHPGDLVALTGPNGSGKSTLLRLLAGIEQPDQGMIRRYGAIGYAPQHGGLDPQLRPDEHFQLFGAMRGLARHQALLEGMRLARDLDWREVPRTPAGKLSGGTRQKLTVISALIGDPLVLLLDEPYQGMDTNGVHRFWELLWAACERGCAAVVASHDATVLARATSVIDLDQVTHAAG